MRHTMPSFKNRKCPEVPVDRGDVDLALRDGEVVEAVLGLAVPVLSQGAAALASGSSEGKS